MLICTGPPITKSEVQNALRRMKDNKGAGPDAFSIDVLKFIEDKHLGMLLDLFNMIYNSRNVPLDWLRSTFVTIPKT